MKNKIKRRKLKKEMNERRIHPERSALSPDCQNMLYRVVSNRCGLERKSVTHGL